MTTFDECGEFWEMRRGDQILSPGPRDVADFGADVCSRQATRPALMRLIGGRRKQHCRGVQDGLRSGRASFPWHTSAPVVVSDSALAGALLSHVPCEAVCRLLVFTGGWPSQAHSSSSDGKLCSMSWKGDGRSCRGRSSSSSAVQV